MTKKATNSLFISTILAGIVIATIFGGVLPKIAATALVTMGYLWKMFTDKNNAQPRTVSYWAENLI